eukprot:TRINITY_DN5719_c0_g1_i1.p1 TRINITY_DN5719_c0_g1~~TRINITY_DN5719_c0_g1_i1.p1  ORF type:complete len:536 (-),score=154.89 TRINITY_DN5719_c0_g1_i1:169-1749(-)
MKKYGHYCLKIKNKFGYTNNYLLRSYNTNEEKKYDFELLVIGGGSGGIACSKDAGLLLGPKKVALLDFVKPSNHGTKWGIGGTCVNVGCIPKKLMHHAALLGESIQYSEHYGWEGIDRKGLQHNWKILRDNVQNHIRSLNWGYRRSNLPEHNVTYLNALGQFIDNHTVQLTHANKKVETITANNIVIAVGGRPTLPDIPGSEHAITSDDIWQLENSPGKTLVVGASYVALECAGFLNGIGCDVSVSVRSILLRGFDQQCSEMIGNYMKDHKKINFMRPSRVEKIEKQENGKLKATISTHQNDNGNGKLLQVEEYDTILYAIGRQAVTKDLLLDKVGVKTNSLNGKILGVNEQTTVPNIYAIGDCLDGVLELTPTAIKSGKLLAQRLYGNSKKQMDYTNIPTTIFTPIEYGCIGYPEDVALSKFGKENIEVYHTYFTPLEWTVGNKGENFCYAKLICDKSDNERIVGLHIVGEHAAEITQGFAVAMKMGATKEDFDGTIGIHPSSTEEFTSLHITKSSGADPFKSGC